MTRSSCALTLPCALALTLILPACSTTWFIEDADAEVTHVLAEADGKALADREQWISQPEPLPDEELELPEAAADGVEAGEIGTPSDDGTRVPLIALTLETALQAGFTTAREYLTREENLYLAGLGLTQTRFNFGPQLDSTVSYLWGDREDGPGSHTARADFGISQLLPTGGTVSMLTGITTNRVGGPHGSDPDKGKSWASDARFSLSQPLLRGAGYDIAWEALTQAERSILYSVRNFELFRQDHAISIIAQYFDLVSQRTQLQNTQRNYEDALYDREKSEALRQLDRSTEESLILARRREVTSRNDLLVAETDYTFALDTFRVRLGLPEADQITIGDEVPPFEAVRLDADSAVSVALGNRLDLITAKETVEDSARQVNISRNGLLPDVDLDLGYGLSDTR